MPRKNTKTIRNHNRSKSQSQNSRKNNMVGLTLTGIMDLKKSGMGYVAVEGQEQDVIVQPNDTMNAMDGDTVKVKIQYISSKGRPEGKITSVVNRSQNEFVGRIELSDNFGFAVIGSAKVPFDVFLPKSELKDVKSGERVVVKIIDWGDGKKNPVGKITELLGDERDNQLVMKEILLENGFKLGFSDEALAEADTYKDEITDEELSRRKDFRGIFTLTIDPHDAKDFDDAISLRTLDDDYYELGVHIADVSHFVREKTKLDQEAYKNATSVYLPDRVLPMLPEHISNLLCSLRPNEDKYTFSAVFEINSKGKIRKHWIGRTVIHSDRRYTYEEAQAIIEGGEDTYRKEVIILDTIAKALRAERFENGALNFNSQEVRYVLDEKGVPVGVVIKESKDANHLIEEFMLLANKYVAKFVQGQKVKGQEIPFPYRVHPLPDEERLAQFASFALKFGYKLNLSNPEEVAESFNKMLKEVEGKPEEHLLQQLGIRTMAKALYTTDNDGHYGLGFEDYCHFTSPIRRYPDVMVHRIVQQCLDKQVIPDANMEDKCGHCSERERKAMEAERSANKYKQVEYMQQFIGHELQAIVSGVSRNGFWAQTVEQKCEGMVSLDELRMIDEFEYIDERYAIVGRHHGMEIRIGDRVVIRVDAANLETKQIDFGLVSLEKNDKEIIIDDLKPSKVQKKKSK